MEILTVNLLNILKNLLFSLIIFSNFVLAAPITDMQKYIKNKSFQALCYHDVRDDVVGGLDPDSVAMNTSRLVEHFAWLKTKGYHVISINEILAARDKGKDLPEKSILLSFDDGYTSFYTKVFPLLKLYNFPAVLAVVGSWMEVPRGETFTYDDKPRPREDLVTWSQVREMQESGLVEIASHSYDLHRGILSTPQGNVQARAVSRGYDPKTKKYESDEEYKNRIYGDLDKSADVIEKFTGIRPRVMVWPYGHFNGLAVEGAEAAGMPITMTLEGGYAPVTPAAELQWTRRFLISANMPASSLVWHLRSWTEFDPIRVVQVDLDYVYDSNPEQQELNLGKLIKRIHDMEINTVYLQAFADPDGDGIADSLYFPNRHLPMRSDLFNRAAWQLRTRASVNVFAWLPMLAFKLPDSENTQHLQVLESIEGKTGINEGHYLRLSPFHPEARQIIGDIYEDLSKYTWFYGLLFHDDGFLTDFEDANPYALDFYKENGLPDSIESIRKDSTLMSRWARLKTQALVDFTDELVKRVHPYRIPLKGTARNMYAQVVLNPHAEEWFAQSMEIFLQRYDYIALMAMPFMEKAESPEEWLKNLIKKVSVYTNGLDKTVFELQSVDWRYDKPIDEDILLQQMRILKLNGALNFGYYPDDFIANHPTLELIIPGISLATYPYKR